MKYKHWKIWTCYSKFPVFVRMCIRPCPRMRMLSHLLTRELYCLAP